MISVEEALERILSYVDVLEAEEKTLFEALGQVLDEDAVSGFDIPPLDNTAMDGYAVRAADTGGASTESPVELSVVGEVAAGYLYEGEVSAGTAVRIMTGAAVPHGADAIVPFEETDEPFEKAPERTHAIEAARVRVFKEARPGANVRRAGEDVKEGQTVVRRGTVLRPAEIGVLASLGRSSVRVIRRPVVAVLSTGDELLDVGQPPAPGKIFDANAYSVGALVRRYGGVPRLLGIAKDTVEALTAKIQEGLGADMLITSAGVSRGDYDVVKGVLAREGEVAFWTVAMKPGKTLAFGCFHKDGRRVPHIGLPGNPVSSMVAFELFGRPALMKMMGKTDWRRPVLRAIAEERIVNRNDPRVFFARCVVREREGRYYASLTGSQSSGVLTSMVQANALTVIPAEVDVVEPGEEIDVIMLDWSQGEEWGRGSHFPIPAPKSPRRRLPPAPQTNKPTNRQTGRS
ncbi:MAG TPA: gephyrin-like molybdotransferase Glp [Dehalococcoidia bacterium]|nr:gephyrin-like molybdotransferase Glp [Dehalococcoidia bacterium]